MLRRSKKPTQNRQPGISESTTLGYLYWTEWVVTRVARIFGLKGTVKLVVERLGV